jgi:hypothetical protein
MYVPAMQTARYIAISDSGFVIVASVSKKTGGAPDSNYPQGRLKLLDKNATIYRDIVPKIVAAEPNAVVTSKTRFVRTGDAIRPRLHVRQCPRSARSGVCLVHPFPSET